jgi:hypothetical protein
MTTIKIIAQHKEQAAQLEEHLFSIIKRNGANAKIEADILSPDVLMSHGVWAKEFPVMAINDHAVWQSTLPPEDIVVSWLKWPSSVDEAVDRILSDIQGEDLEALLADPLREAMLGQGIRNGFGLWTGNVALQRSCGAEGIDADEASLIIIEALKTRCVNSPTSPPEDISKQMHTPAGHILMWAYNLAYDTDEILRKEFPQIAQYPDGEKFGNLLQVANIIATLIRVERYLGVNDYTALHASLKQSIACSVRDIYLPPLLELSCFLLKKDRSSLLNNEIPAFNEILGEDENLLASSIATWLVWSMKKQKLSEESELRLVSVLQNLIYTKNAQLIASMFLSDKKSFNRFA